MRKITLTFLFLSVTVFKLHSYSLVAPLRIIAHGTGMVYSGLFTIGGVVGTIGLVRDICAQKSMVLTDKICHAGSLIACGGGVTYASFSATRYFYEGVKKEIQMVNAVEPCD